MTKSITQLRIPSPGEYVRRIGRLIAIEDPPPEPTPPKEYVFEEKSARCELRRNGKCIDTLSSFGDYYGEGSAEQEAIKDMIEYVADERIVPESEVEVVVIRVVEQVRKRVRRDGANCYNGDYFAFENLPYGCKRALPDAVETIVWSSRQPDNGKGDPHVHY